MKRLTMHPNVRWAFLLSVLGLAAAAFATRAVPARAEEPTAGSQEEVAPTQGLTFAQIQDDSKEPPPPTDDSFTEEKRPVGTIRKLTPEEINRVRFMELRGMRLRTDRPDRVAVKVPKSTISDFLLDMEGHPEFRGEQTRKQFRRLTAPQKLHWIARYTGTKYADRVEIKSDPEVFVTFKKQVFPVLLRSCATSGCHGYGTSRRPFVLFNDPKRSVDTTYADFVAISTFQYNGHYIIDRAHPEDSLLLTYLLPEKDVKPELRHPGHVEVKPGYRSRKVIGYRRIKDWISSLKHPAEDYGVNLWSDEEAEPTAEEGVKEEKPTSIEPQDTP